ncbi:MAG: hypothetical protein JNJ77_12270 [Planctomycetia bacterium]|nr:hypothetical protein [Planctomycetia bacterium]
MKSIVTCLFALTILPVNTYSQIPTGTSSLVETANINQNPTTALKDPSNEAASLKLLSQGLDDVSKRLTITTADDQFKILIFGSLVGETISSTQRITSPGSYLFVNPFLGRDSPGIEVQGRGTSLGAMLVGPEIAGFQSGGQFLVYLYGQSPFANLYGLFFAFAYADLKNDDWRFAFGLNQDVFNPLNPGTMNFGYGLEAGNTGFIRGSFRVERFLKASDDFQITLQSAIGQPVITEFAAPFPGSDITLGETTGLPNLEGRIAFGFGAIEQRTGSPTPTRRVELGLSGLIGQVRTSSETTRVYANTASVGVDLTAYLSEQLGFKAEFYQGQAMGSYFGGSGQSVNIETFRAIRSLGGWAEVWYYLTPALHTHWGAGIDDPRDGDVGNNQRVQNQFAFGNLIWDVTKNLQLGFEVGRYDTDWNLPNIPSTHAWIFHTRVALKF